jgi:hypothetical protein
MWYHPHDPDAPDDDEIPERDDDDFDPPDDDDSDSSYMPLTDLEERYNAL